LKSNGDTRATLRKNGGFRADWQTKAACRDYADAYLDPWDADPHEGKVNATAHAFCRHCPVKRECLLAGLRSDELNNGLAFGIWGDTAPKQRRAMTRQRYRLACPVCKGDLIITDESAAWQACAACGLAWECRRRKPITAD
jgi:hypothetical protein